MSPLKKNSHLLGNSLWNASAFAVTVGLNFLVLPFVVFELGASTFGVAGLVLACIAPALAFSNALGSSTTREIADRLTPADREEAGRFFATALWLAGAGGVTIATLLALLGPPVACRIFHLDSEEADDLTRAFLFGAVGWLCQCFSTVISALFTARQDYARLASISVLIVVVSTVSMLLFIPFWPQASTYIGCGALGFAAGLLMSVIFFFRVMEGGVVRPVLHRKPLGDLLGVGGWQFLAQVGGVIAGQADRYLLGMFLAPKFVGYYTIALQIETAVYFGILKITETLFPFFSSMQKESSARVADLLFRSSWALNLLAATCLGGIIPVAGPLLDTWTGREVADEAQAVLVTLAVAGMLGCASNVFAYYLLAMGRSRATALIMLIPAITTVISSAIWLTYFGWQAAGWGVMLGMIAQISVTTVLLRRSFELPRLWSRLFHLVLQPLGTGIAVGIALRYFVADRLFEHAPRWWFVGISYGAAAGIIFVVVVVVSSIGPYGESCWRDLRLIASRFLLRAGV